MHTNSVKRRLSIQQQARIDRLRMWTHGILFGLLLAIAGSFSSSRAQGSQTPCGVDEEDCRIVGGFSAVYVPDPLLLPESPWVSSASAASFGALVYSDFIQVEEKAYKRLSDAATLRASISPYKGNVSFDTFLRNLHYESGLSSVPGGTFTSPYEPGLTVLQLLNRAEADLNEARCL